MIDTGDYELITQNRGNQEVANNELNHKDLGKIDVIVTQGIWTLSRYGYSRRGLAAVFADQTLPEDIRKSVSI